MLFQIIGAVILGLLFGSLASCIFQEYAKGGKSIFLNMIKINGCPKCKKLKWYEKFPMLSFIYQKGRCKYCKKRLSYIPPIVELMTIIMFFLIYRYFIPQGVGVTIYWMLTGRLLLILALYDIIYYEIYIPALIFAIILFVIGLLLGLFPLSSLQGGLILFIIFLVIYIISYFYVKAKYKVSEEGLGMGDVIVSPYLGSLLFVGVSSFNKEYLYFYVLFFLIITSLIGIGFYLIQNKLLKKTATFLNNKEMEGSSLPLIPAMIIAVIIMLTFQSGLCGRILSNCVN